MTDKEKKEYRRNYYLKNKDRELELMKIYRENNKNEIKEYRDEYYNNNSEYFRAYRNQYEKQFQKDAVYLLINREQKVLYCGSTSNLYKRIVGKHRCGHSNLKLTHDRWRDLECHHWEYCYIDGLNSKNERLYIEKMLIEKFNPMLNKYDPIKNVYGIDELRKSELEDMADKLVFKLWDK